MSVKEWVCYVKVTCMTPPALSHIQQLEAAAAVQSAHRRQLTARLLYVLPGLICIENINQEGSVGGNLPVFRTETDCAPEVFRMRVCVPRLRRRTRRLQYCHYACTLMLAAAEWCFNWPSGPTSFVEATWWQTRASWPAKDSPLRTNIAVNAPGTSRWVLTMSKKRQCHYCAQMSTFCFLSAFVSQHENDNNNINV